MALKNTYTTITTSKSVEAIRVALVGAGVREIMFEYSETGEPTEVKFYMPYQGGKIPVKLPAKVENVYKILNSERKRYSINMDVAYRVAWKNIYDWIVAQLALIKIDQAEIFEVFMPYIALGNGKTLFEAQRDSILNLPEGGQGER